MDAGLEAGPGEHGAPAESGEGADALARCFAHRAEFFARKVAREWMLGQRWSDELVSAGYWGLAVALANRRADASERELSAYVSQRIEGAVLDEARRCLRRTRWMEVDSPWGPDDDGDSLPTEATARMTDPGQSPEEHAGRIRQRRIIERALAELDPEDRRLLHAYMEGDSLTEIARRFEVPVGTLRVRFGRVTRRLRSRDSAVRHARLDGPD
ncbi:MAG: sigma-70 family RNA polymerase sigma factor [Myxococcota bacterium]